MARSTDNLAERLELVRDRVELDIAGVEERLLFLEALRARLTDLIAWLEGDTPPPVTGATYAVLTIIKGDIMPGEINVDTTTGVATLVFKDNHGDDAAVPNGTDGQPVAVAFASSDTSVLTIDPSTGHITPVLMGTADVSVTINNTDGTPALEPDGVTPFAPANVSVPVVAGPAGTAVLAVNS